MAKRNTWKTIYRLVWGAHKANRLKEKPRDELNHWRLHPEVKKWRAQNDYKKHRNQYILRAQKHYNNNIENKREYGRKHSRQNSEAYAVRARGRKKDIKLTLDPKSNIFYKFRDFLNSVHGKTMYHVDHIIPLAKGGTHSFKNLAIATASYNQWKRARIITDPSIYFGSSQIK